MKLRKERKVENGGSNLPGRFKRKVVQPDTKLAENLDYFSMPEEEQYALLGSQDRYNPDPYAATEALYLTASKKRKNKDGHLIEVKTAVRDIVDESNYVKGQSSLAVDYQKGINLIEKLNINRRLD
jgi:hypothetical protein